MKSHYDSARKIAETATPKEARTMLDALRWSIDMKVYDEFGDHVWLGPYYDKNGKRIGVTQCCLVDDPCEHHSALAAPDDH